MEKFGSMLKLVHQYRVVKKNTLITTSTLSSSHQLDSETSQSFSSRVNRVSSYHIYAVLNLYSPIYIPFLLSYIVYYIPLPLMSLFNPPTLFSQPVSTLTLYTLRTIDVYFVRSMLSCTPTKYRYPSEPVVAVGLDTVSDKGRKSLRIQ